MALHAPLVSPIPLREYEEARAFIEEHRLKENDPGIYAQFMSINMNDLKAIHVFVWRIIKKRLADYKKYHEQDNPFPTAPESLFPEGYCIGRQVSNNASIRITQEQLLRHMGASGSTGTGKTSFMRPLVQQVLADAKVFFFDPKLDWLSTAANDHRFLLLSSQTRMNLLQIPDYLTLPRLSNTFRVIWNRCLWGGTNQAQVFDQAFTTAFADHDTPCLADLHRIIDRMQSPKLTYQRRDAITGVSNRLHQFAATFPGLYSTRRGISYDTLFQHPLYLHTLTNDEHTTFVYTLLVYLLYTQNAARNTRDTLDYLLVNDEGNRFWNRQQNNIEEAPPLVELAGRFRELSIALLYSSVNEATLHPILKSNTYTNVALNMTSGAEERETEQTFVLTPDQRTYLSKRLRRGEVIVKFGDTWREPLLLYYDYLPIDKAVPLAQRTEAEERINAYAPADLPPQANTQAPPTEQQPTTPAPAPPLSASTAPPAAPVAQAKPSKPALSANEDKLLVSVGEKLEPVSNKYTALGFHPTTGNRAKQKLLALGLVEEHVLTVRKGRGNQAHILFATDAGYAHLAMKRPKQTRGGDSPQHQYLVLTIARHLPESHIEFTLAGKSMDLYIRYTQSLHHALLDHQQEIFGRNDLTFTEGDHLAIEIEVSDPEKTGPANVTQNAAAGITQTIVLVMPDQLDKTRKLLAKNPHCIVGDALAMLDFLRGAP